MGIAVKFSKVMQGCTLRMQIASLVKNHNCHCSRSYLASTQRRLVCPNPVVSCLAAPADALLPPPLPPPNIGRLSAGLYALSLSLSLSPPLRPARYVPAAPAAMPLQKPGLQPGALAVDVDLYPDGGRGSYGGGGSSPPPPNHGRPPLSKRRGGGRRASGVALALVQAL